MFNKLKMESGKNINRTQGFYRTLIMCIIVFSLFILMKCIHINFIKYLKLLFVPQDNNAVDQNAVLVLLANHKCLISSCIYGLMFSHSDFFLHIFLRRIPIRFRPHSRGEDELIKHSHTHNESLPYVPSQACCLKMRSSW